MNFFTLSPALKEAVCDLENRVIVRLVIDEVLTLEKEILKARFTSYLNERGGVISRGYVSFEEPLDCDFLLSDVSHRVEVWFSCGTCGEYLHRFTFYPNEKGFSRIREGGEANRFEVVLEDVAARMERVGGFRDWSEPDVYIDCEFANKERPEKSLLHCLARKAGIEASEIDCCNVPIVLPYLKVSKNPWEELCDLAYACFALVEGGTDKKIVFSNSPYLTGESEKKEPEVLHLNQFFKVEQSDALDLFFNDVRLRINKAQWREKQVLWTYGESPIEFDSELRPLFRFAPLGQKRAIEEPFYGAEYSVKEGGKVVLALDVSDLEQMREQLPEGLDISFYSVSAYPHKALIKLECESECTLKEFVIEGKPLVVLSNCSCYRRNEELIKAYGLRVLNVSSKYYCDFKIKGKAHFEIWCEKRLEESCTLRKRVWGASEQGLFGARCGALIHFDKRNFTLERLVLRYKRRGGFYSELTMVEGF